MPNRNMAAWLSPEAKSRVLEIGEACLPYEACGLIMPPDEVVQLPNMANGDRHGSYEVNPEDLAEAIRRFGAKLPDEALTRLSRDSFIIWHTHPAGLIGPSARDIATKVEGFRYLVVALPHGQSTMF